MKANVLQKLRRLTEMSLPEIRFRVEQQARFSRQKWQLWRAGTLEAPETWDFWDAQEIHDPALRSALLSRNYSQAERLLPDYFAARRSPRFFCDMADRERIVASFPVTFPGRTAEITAEADALAALRLRIFSYPEVCCQPKIPWRRDLIHSVETDIRHHTEIPFLNFDKVGDAKLVWEPNRHQYFVTLGLTYLLTQQDSYAEVLMSHFEDWLEQNPYARGINWASSLEVAFRSWSWLWSLYLLAESSTLTGERIARMAAALARNAAFISENLSTYFSPNTHLIGEGFALFCTGLTLPELRGAEAWRDLGRTILIEEMSKQVRDDGSHVEQSSYYHRYTAEFFLCASILAERNGHPFPDSFQRKLIKVFEFLQSISTPAGHDPGLGDADGGRLIPLGANHPLDFRPILSTAAAYFRRTDFKASAKDFHEQTLWLLGPTSRAIFDSLEPEAPKETSRSFCDAGLVAMRTDWTNHARFLLFDAGVQGMGNSAHGHADALGIICSADGLDWLVDSGTYVYTASPTWRDFFRSTKAHNTLVVDGCEQATPGDCFKWTNMPTVALERFVSLPEIDFAVGTHDGFARSANPVRHRRRVLFVKPDYWIISDELLGSGTHDLEFAFHFAPGVELRKIGTSWLAAKNDKTFALVPAATDLEFRVACGEKSPIQGWYSKDYGQREPAPVLLGKGRAVAARSFHWLLMPNASNLPGLFRSFADDSAVGVHGVEWEDQIQVGPREPSSYPMGIATDAALTVLRRSSGLVARLVLLNGSAVASAGQKLFQSQTKLRELSVSWRDAVADIRLHPASSFRLYSPNAANVILNGKPALVHRDGDWIEFKEMS